MQFLYAFCCKILLDYRINFTWIKVWKTSNKKVVEHVGKAGFSSILKFLPTVKSLFPCKKESLQSKKKNSCVYTFVRWNRSALNPAMHERTMLLPNTAPLGRWQGSGRSLWSSSQQLGRDFVVMPFLMLFLFMLFELHQWSERRSACDINGISQPCLNGGW